MAAWEGTCINKKCWFASTVLWEVCHTLPIKFPEVAHALYDRVSAAIAERPFPHRNNYEEIAMGCFNGVVSIRCTPILFANSGLERHIEVPGKPFIDERLQLRLRDREGCQLIHKLAYTARELMYELPRTLSAHKVLRNPRES
jgi:hypothetical protein